MEHEINSETQRLTMTGPEAFKLRTVLNQVLGCGRGSINEVSGRMVDWDRVEILIGGMK